MIYRLELSALEWGMIYGLKLVWEKANSPSPELVAKVDAIFERVQQIGP